MILLSNYVCKNCVNDDSVVGISFNKDNLCSYCEEYYLHEKELCDYENLEKLWIDRVNLYKGKGPYDAIVGISGGKDSTYVLYNLINKYKLKVLAITIDNGFLNSWSKDRINSLVKDLNVDHQYIEYPKEILSELYKLSIKSTGAICTGCSCMIYMASVQLASKLGVPMVVHGRSRSQMLKNLSFNKINDISLPFLLSALKPANTKALELTYKSIFETINSSFPKEFVCKLEDYFPKFPDGKPVEFAPYFLYHKYNELEMVNFLEKNMDWKRPNDYQVLSHYDCDAHDGCSYLYEIAESHPHIMTELSFSIREGSMSRHEGLKRLHEENFTKIPQKSMDSISKYTNWNTQELIKIAENLRDNKRPITQTK